MKLSGKRLPLLLVALFAALALIVAGCGGDDGDDGATVANVETEVTTADGDGDSAEESDAAEPADEDFVAAVTEVCERAKAASAAAGVDDDFETDGTDPEAFADEFVKRFDKIKEVFKQAFVELHEITPPAALSSDYEEFLTTNERMMELTEQAIDAFADDPDFVMSEADMQEQQELSDNYDALIESLGLPGDCFDDTPS